MTAVAQMFSKPKMSMPTVAVPDPDEDGPVAQDARKRLLGARAQKSGRASTMLSDAMASIGADYSGTTTGAG